MNWLQKYYDWRATHRDETEFLWQTGHTVGGVPMADDALDLLLDPIRDALALSGDDVLLDLCCGNGYLTKRLAGDVARIVAIDFSAEMIRLARSHNSADNIEYHHGDVKRLATHLPRVTKVLMMYALQHFTPGEVRGLLGDLKNRMGTGGVIVFAGVPDFNARADFYAGRRQTLSIRLRRLIGRDLMGVWWKKSELAKICAEMGLSAEFLAIDPALDNARFRMDVRVS